MAAPPPTAGRHRRPALGLPGRAALLGILASLVVLLASGVGLGLTSGAPAADLPERSGPPEVTAALGAAPSPTATAAPTPSAAPTPEPEPEPEPPPPPPPEPDPVEEVSDEITGFEDEVTALTNAERAAAGCDELATDERLRTSARGHSQDMAANDYFEHTSLDGRSPFERMADAGYPDPAAENIAFGYRTPADVTAGWMDSQGHRENILNCSYRAIGVGLAYDGSGRPYWTQNFGR